MKTSLPTISIITVCYNSVLTIEETILSILRQNYPHFDYVIIDGGSTDGTLDIIEKTETKLATSVLRRIMELAMPSIRVSDIVKVKSLAL